jgi:hypothetical protein
MSPGPSGELVEQVAGGFHHVQIGALVAAADIVGFSDLSSLK